MQRKSLNGIFGMGAGFVLFVACSGKVQSLGEKAGVGGKRAVSGVSSGGAHSGGASGSSAVGAGGTMAATGGTMAAAGGTMAATGGTMAATGGARSMAGYSSFAGVAGPIDPNCKCSSPNQVCNVVNECVNACDTAGRCAIDLTNRAVKSIYHDGVALYYVTRRSTDVLGNPGPVNASLFRIGSDSTARTLVAAGLDEPERILGRYQGSTFIVAAPAPNNRAILEVTDAGVVTKLADATTKAVNMHGEWLVYANADRLMGIDLELGRSPAVLQVSAAGATLDDAVIVGDVAISRLVAGTVVDSCAVTMTAPEQKPTCGIAAFNDISSTFLAADASRLYIGDGTNPIVRAYDANGIAHLVLFNSPTTKAVTTTLESNGWLYSYIRSKAGQWSPELAEVVRYPTTVGRLPQSILPSDLGTELFAVDKSYFYWTYPQTSANAAHYIFRTPLPAQPCDPDFPCADTAQVCTNGLCAAP